MPVTVPVIIGTAWILWCVPFLLLRFVGPRRHSGGDRPTIDRRARWGIVIEAIAFFLVWQVRFWERAPSHGRLIAGTMVLLLAPLLTWSSAFFLGRQWRFDAGLNADHRLVTGGAYRVVRHPIYASMLCLLVGTGLLVTPWVLLLPAIPIFLAGTEIRVRIEDRLLAERFGEEFLDYRRRVAAYVPFIR